MILLLLLTYLDIEDAVEYFYPYYNLADYSLYPAAVVVKGVGEPRGGAIRAALKVVEGILEDEAEQGIS